MKETLPFLRAFKPKFKGEIWENAERFQLVGAGYKSMPPAQNGYFDIRTANHLRGPLKALNDPDVRTVIIVGATQCLKSVCGDIWIVHLVEHESDSILCLFEDDPKAKLYADTRCMDTVKQHPVISEMISDILQEDTQGRHKVTNTQIKFNGSRLLKICGLNDGNVSSLSWRFIWLSEAWQHKSDGLLKKAIRRADRYADTCKILIESQAGLAGEDLHSEASAAHQVPVTWACPLCGGRQSWECGNEYDQLRPVDFVPRKPNLPVGQLEMWSAPLPGSIAGMKIPPGEQPATAEGEAKHLTLEDRARRAYWECYWCGGKIEDTRENRLAIAASYDQDYTLPPTRAGMPRRKPKQVCFIIPREANYTNTFESGALSYLKAKEAQSSGNEIPLQDWYMSERAIFYSAKLSQTRVAVITGSMIDPKIAIPNESFRSLKVDCQKDVVESLRQGKDLTGHFWAIAEAHDKQGNTFMLWRGYATSWEELFGTVKYKAKADGTVERVIEGGIKNKLMIPTRNVAIDGGNWFDIVKEKAAHYRTKEQSIDGTGKMVWATWKIMVGDDGKGTRWPDDGVWRSYWPPKTYMVDTLEPDGKTWLKIAVQVTRWSNFAVKSILYKLRMGGPGQPKFVALDVTQCDKKTQAKEKGEFAYQEQMDGFKLGEDAKGRPKFIELHKQQHYPDCHCMGIVLKMMKGLVRGETAAGDGVGQDVEKK